MTQKFECDRCKKTTEKQIAVVTFIEHEIDINSHERDLCKECIEAFYKFMKNEKIESEYIGGKTEKTHEIKNDFYWR